MPSQCYSAERRSSIVALGLNAATAPVALREKLALPEAEWPRAIGELTELTHVSEAAVLSTCNRMELYLIARSFHPAVQEASTWLADLSGVPAEELRPHLFLLRDRDAVGHVLRVAGGLESVVLGEGQILAQVKAATRAHEQSGGVGKHLAALLRAALGAGKRVRTETRIGEGAVSVSSAAADLADSMAKGGLLWSRHHGYAPLALGHGGTSSSGAPPPTRGPPASAPLREDVSGLSPAALPHEDPSRPTLDRPPPSAPLRLRDLSILVVGAGKMSGLLLRHLAGLGVPSVELIRRSPERAAALKEAVEADTGMRVVVVPPERLRERLDACDVVFGAASNEGHLLTRADFSAAALPPLLATRLAVDMGVPRCFEESEDHESGATGAGGAAGDGGAVPPRAPPTLPAPPPAARPGRPAYIYRDVDDLARVVSEAGSARRAAALEAEALLEEEVTAYEAWRDSLDAVPAIRALRAHADTIREGELTKAAARLPGDLPPKARRAVDELARGIVNKLLHGPLSALRGGAGPVGAGDGGDQAENIRALERMFPLEDIRRRFAREDASASRAERGGAGAGSAAPAPPRAPPKRRGAARADEGGSASAASPPPTPPRPATPDLAPPPSATLPPAPAPALAAR